MSERPAPSPAAPTRDSLADVRTRLEELRGRLRRRFLLDGTVRLLVTLAGLVAASFLADRLLDLPIGVRAVLLVVAASLAVTVAVRRIVRPLLVPLPDEQLALALEARRPELRDRLISALQFVRQVEDPENEESVELIAAVVRETAELARGDGLRAELSSRSLRLGAAALAGLLLAAGIVAVSRPDLVEIWAQRALLREVPWPRATTLVVLNVSPDQPIVLTRGADLAILVEARGTVPDDVRIVYRPLEEEDASEDARRMYRLPETKSRFQFEFREIPRSFSFTVRGGDDDDDEPVYVVHALIPPSVESIAARCVYPDYTRQPPQTLTLGDFEVPVGTRVDLSITTNMLVRSARFSRENGEAVPLEPRADRTCGLSFVVEQSFQYAILLEGPEGQRNRPERDTYRVTAVPDRRPEVRLLSPTSADLFSPQALLPLKVLATDNYGVDSVSLVHRSGRSGAEQVEPVRNLSPEGGREVIAFDPRELSSLRTSEGRAPQEGDILLLQVVARDNNGMEDRSPDIEILVAEPSEVERQLGQRQVALKEDATLASSIQREARDAVRLLQGVEVDRATIDRLRDVQILQGRVTRKTEEFLSGIERVLNGYVFNRLGGNPIAGEAMLRIYVEELTRDREDLSRVFKPGLYARIVAAYRSGEIFDPEVLGILVQIIEVATAIAQEDSPRAHQLLSTVVRAEAADPAAVLRDVEETQSACLARFESLMKMMRRWETYHEFVVRMKEIEDAQRSITEGARQALR